MVGLGITAALQTMSASLTKVNCYEYVSKHVCASEESDYILPTFKTEASRTIPGTQYNLHICLLIWVN